MGRQPAPRDPGAFEGINLDQEASVLLEQLEQEPANCSQDGQHVLTRTSRTRSTAETSPSQPTLEAPCLS